MLVVHGIAEFFKNSLHNHLFAENFWNVYSAEPFEQNPA